MLIRWWKNLSVAKKLYSVVGIMAVLIATELFTLLFAMHTLSAVRAFVNGEALWSKAQKDSVSSLEKYVITRDRRYYDAFEGYLKVPLGDHRARMQLESQQFDLAAASEGFLEGGNHPNDVLGMINLFRKFYWVPHLTRAIEKWRQADELISELRELGKRMDEALSHRSTNPATETAGFLNDLSAMNTRFTTMENGFSATLGEASRWLERLLMIILVIAVATIESTGLFLTVSFTRSLTRVLSELNQAAQLVGKGDFSQSVPVRSADELGQLAFALNNMTANLQEQVSERAQAEQASKAKNLFLANMSHEIRTPLNAILGFAAMLRDARVGEADKDRYLQIIKRTGANLTRIIDDILDISEVEAEKIEITTTEFSLTEMLSDVQLLLQLRAGEKGIKLGIESRGEVSAFIRSDPARLRQILLNVIGNSLKFTDHGAVAVTCEPSGPELLFLVKDTGVGIEPGKVDLLFKAFSQGDLTVRKRFGGTGLGLTLSRRLARLLGGDVGLIGSIPGKGSTFFIRVPYQPVAGGVADKNLENSAPSTATLEGKRILVAEDMKDNQALIACYLELSGATVEFASNGEEAVQKSLGERFDVILMDMQMPIKDGYAATEELRSRGCQVPVIALTGYAMRNDRERCLTSGCNDFLTKPVDQNRLITTLTKYLRAA